MLSVWLAATTHSAPTAAPKCHPQLTACETGSVETKPTAGPGCLLPEEAPDQHEFQVGGCGQLHPLELGFWAVKLWRVQGVGEIS